MLPAPAVTPVRSTSAARHGRPAPGALVPLLVTALLAALAVALPARPAAAQGPGTSTVLSQVNASRAAAGLRPLSLAGDLSSVAYAWSQHLAASGTLGHNPNLTGQVDDWQVVGENVGYGPTVTDIETAFMNSPRHRANILEPRYTQIGLGVVVDASGTAWVTQVFRKPLTATTTTTSTTKSTSTTTATKSTSSKTTSSKSTSTGTPARTGTTAASGSGAATATTGSRPAAPRPTATAAVRPTTTSSPRASAAPDLQQLLAERLAAAAEARPGTSADPVDAALGWAATMDTLAG
ncbi:MAG: CAP domain-containing protein [Motilibacteraceae bacterium]